MNVHNRLYVDDLRLTTSSFQSLAAAERVEVDPGDCPVCGSTNLGWPVYKNAAGVRWVNGIPLWFPQHSGSSPPYSHHQPKRPRVHP